MELGFTSSKDSNYNPDYYTQQNFISQEKENEVSTIKTRLKEKKKYVGSLWQFYRKQLKEYFIMERKINTSMRL